MLRMSHLMVVCCVVHYAYTTSFLTHESGMLSVYEQKFEFQYSLNMNEYLFATKLLGECIDNLKLLCTRSHMEACNYFLQTINNVKIDFEFDISKFHFERKKRDLLNLFHVETVGSVITSLLSGLFPIRDALRDVRHNLNGNLDLVRIINNISYNSVQLQELLTNETESITSLLNDKIFNLTELVKNDQLFNNIMNTIIFSIFKHERYQNKLNLVYANQLNSRLFEIIDFRNLSKMIRMVNENDLGPNLYIAEIKSVRDRGFIHSFSKMNESHLIIFVQMPVLNRELWNIWNFIPIPVWNARVLLMLNESRIKFFRKDSMIYNFSEKTETKYCLNHENHTICNSFILGELSEVSECISNLLVNNSDSYCLYEKTELENYFYEISETLVYVFIVEPIEIFIQCPNVEKVLQLTQSQHFGFGKDCTIYRKSNLHINKTRLMTLDVLVNGLRPNVSVGIQDQREKIEIFKEYRQTFAKIYNDLSVLNQNITFQKQNINNIRETSTNFFTDIWLSIKFFFSNIISRYVFTLLGILLGIYLCVCLVKVIGRRTCSTK